MNAHTNQAATHRCKICGCLWRENDDGSWSWVPMCAGPQTLGACCDNVTMGEQIEALAGPPVADEHSEER